MPKGRHKYKRVLLKLTGGLFGYENGRGINFEAYENISKQIISIWKKTKVELVIVIGGGNIFRGREKNQQVDQATADYMGMMATIINGMALQEALERLGAPTRMMTAFEVKAVAEPYVRRVAQSHLKRERIVILTAGIGSPFFTTDSGAALRAVEIGCDVLLKATNVDGAYSSDPKINKKARLYKHISYDEAIRQDLKIMDTTAFVLCKKEKMPIIVFNIKKLTKLDEILQGKGTYTLID